jgi:hypothetical protein
MVKGIKVELAIEHLECALRGRLLWKDDKFKNRGEGGFDFFPDYEKIQRDVEQALVILKTIGA